MNRYLHFGAISLLISLVACDGTTGSIPDGGETGEGISALCPDDDGSVLRPSDWTVESHCSGGDADYETLFADDVVHRIDIVVAADDHQATMDDLASLLSSGGPGADLSEEPIWVPVSVGFAGKWWQQVGMRYKGNSSLRSAWQQGVRKLSFRLNFDRYEDDYPELDDQRFFGFKKMTFSNGFKDPSLIRDKLAADLFRQAGVPAARGAFARVFLDSGDGPVYLGLYTMIEDPSNRMLDTQFDDDSGNLYKPEGEGAKWGVFIEEHFIKQTNEEEADWSDVRAAFDALHAVARVTAPAQWRAELEATFDAPGFLRCLAMNQTMVNWDSYGFMSHNYYLYADPADTDHPGRLRWFPWDLNEAMLFEDRGPAAGAGEVLLESVSTEWPLIRFLLDDVTYLQLYADALQEMLDGAFAVDAVQASMQRYHDLIAPYVVGADGERAPYTFLTSDSQFDTSLSATQGGLLQHVVARHEAVQAALVGLR